MGMATLCYCYCLDQRRFGFSVRNVKIEKDFCITSIVAGNSLCSLIMSTEIGCCHSQISSVYQTLDEIDFERGIWYFAMHGDMVNLKGKLDNGVDISTRDSAGYTALHYAARNGKKEACALLLYRGANANAKTHGGATPLHRAALQGHTDIIKLLVKYNADPSISDNDGKTALHKAAEGQHLEISKIFLRIKPELKSKKDKRGYIPLFYADPAKLELTDLLS